MPRQARQCPGGLVYHVWNRAAGRLRLFKKPQDYAAFERIMIEAHQRHPLGLLEWCLMPNHWHFVVRPKADGEVTAFFRWLTHTHAMRAITHRRVLGMGPLYQGRFKSLPVQEDEHLLILLRYVQRNPVRAGLVEEVRRWPHGGEWARGGGNADLRALLSDWPVRRPGDWVAWVNQPQTASEVDAVREHVRRSRPYGTDAWMRRTAAQLGLTWTLHQRGGYRRKVAPTQEETL
jgi:putative transposase